jgi:hypothetical protein
MKLAKAAVLDFIDAAIEKLRASHVKQQQEAVAQYDKRELELNTKWDRFLAVATAARKKGSPITNTMIKMLGTGDYFYLSSLASEKPSSDPFKVPDDLAGMKALVSVVIEDQVDIKTLSSADLRDIFKKYSR